MQTEAWFTRRGKSEPPSVIVWLQVSGSRSGRVVLGWLAVAVVEGAYYQALERGMHHAVDEFHQRRVGRAQGGT